MGDTPLFHEWIRSQVAAEGYWFHRMELPGGVVTPGWSDPREDKLPHFAWPDGSRTYQVI